MVALDSLSTILIRNLSLPPPPGAWPSVEVRRNPKLPAPLIWPEPLNCALAPDTTSQSYDVLWKLRSPALNWNSVSPVGVLWPFLYFDTKPKLALPVSAGTAG